MLTLIHSAFRDTLCLYISGFAAGRKDTIKHMHLTHLNGIKDR